MHLETFLCLELHIIINNYIQNVNTNPSRFLLELKTKHEIQTGHKKKNQTNKQKKELKTKKNLNEMEWQKLHQKYRK